MTPAQSVKLARMQAVSFALRIAAADSWASGNLRTAAGLFARFDLAETRAFEYEIEVRYPDAMAVRVGVDDLFKYGRTML